MSFLSGARRASSRCARKIVRRTQRIHRGVTLIEMMVALVVTLIMMAAVIGAFAMVSGTINDGRSMMEMSDRVRAAVQRVRLDLAGITCPTLPWARPEAGGGYVEIIKGKSTDSSPDPLILKALTAAGQVDTTVYGAGDDILIFTTRSSGEPFVNGSNQQSQVAEVLWACVPDLNSPASNPYYSLYRVTNLVLPSATTLAEVSNDGKVAMSLGDLTKRENRTHGFRGKAFPFEFDAAGFRAWAQGNPAQSAKYIVLSNVVAFDVKVWDPTAPTYASNGVTLVPGDIGYGTGNAGLPGAYADLGYKPPSGTLRFAGPPAAKSKLTMPTWDTWPMHYEYDNTGMNGLKDGPGGIDDINERLTSPPYPFPLRGIQIKIRVYEPDSRQIQEVTVVEHFLPE